MWDDVVSSVNHRRSHAAEKLLIVEKLLFIDGNHQQRTDWWVLSHFVFSYLRMTWDGYPVEPATRSRTVSSWSEKQLLSLMILVVSYLYWEKNYKELAGRGIFWLWTIRKLELAFNQWLSLFRAGSAMWTELVITTECFIDSDGWQYCFVTIYDVHWCPFDVHWCPLIRVKTPRINGYSCVTNRLHLYIYFHFG